jgi:hypothetical protein
MKKRILQIVCPLLAVVLVITGVWFFTQKGEQTPVDSKTEAPTVAKAESAFPLIPQNKIFGTLGISNNWAIPVDDPEAMLEGTAAVVRAKVISVGGAVFLPSTNKYGDYLKTPVKLQITEVLGGNYNPEKTTVYMEPRYVTVAQYLKQNETSGQKAGMLTIPESERDSTYIGLFNEDSDDFDLKKDTEYILLLSRKNDSGEYFIESGGYSIFTADAKNVLTGNELKSFAVGKTQ